MQQLTLFRFKKNESVSAVQFVADLKKAMRESVKNSGLSRAHVVDEMNRIAELSGKSLTQGRKAAISQDTLDKWLADESRGQMPNIYALHVFMAVTKSISPLQAWASFLGCIIATEKDQEFLEYGRLVIEEKRRTKLKRKLEEKLLER